TENDAVYGPCTSVEGIEQTSRVADLIERPTRRILRFLDDERSRRRGRLCQRHDDRHEPAGRRDVRGGNVRGAERQQMRKPYLGVTAILFILGGCAGPRVRVAPPSSALRAEILSVGLDVTSSPGPADVETPIKGKGRGALVGAGLGTLCDLTNILTARAPTNSVTPGLNL